MKFIILKLETEQPFIESLHNLVMKQNAKRVILSDTSESDLGDDQEKCDAKDMTFHGKTPVLKRKNVNEQCQHQQPAPREPLVVTAF